MTSDYPTRYRELSAGFRSLAEVQPAVMDGFSRLHRGAVSAGALTWKHKELMALAISIALRCDGCITLHVHAAVKAGATAEEVADTIGVAVLMGGGPAAVYGTEAMTAYQQIAAELAA